MRCGVRVPNNIPDSGEPKMTERRNYKIDPKNEDSSSWELWCHNTLTDTWVFYKKELILSYMALIKTHEQQPVEIKYPVRVQSKKNNLCFILT